MGNIYQLGIEIILFLQGLGEWIFAPMKFFTFLGNEEFFLLVTPILYWSLDTRIGIRTALMLMFSSGTYNLGKWLFHTPRPYWISDQVRLFRAESSFGTPSGHATSAVAIWGYLAASFRKTWFWIVAILLMVLIGLSRLVLAVHFPHDVLLGWILGTVILLLYLHFEPGISRWLGKKSTTYKLAIAFLASLVLILLALLVVLSQASDPLPAGWVENAAIAFPEEPPLEPFTLAGQITVAGTLFGLAAGHSFLFSNSGYNTRGLWWHHFLRYLLGILGVLILWAGLDAVFPDGDTLIPYIFRYLRYGLVGFWITYLAPRIFIHLKIALPSSSQ
jgi:membrane-associated phospholipid phosphatase